MFFGDGKNDQRGLLALLPALSKRQVVAATATVGFILILLHGHSIKPVAAKYKAAKALYTNNILDNINNSTLGFEKIFVMGLASRTDRRDGMVLQAALSNMAIEFIDGAVADDIPEKAIPVDEDRKHLKGGALGSWRGHINALQEIVRRNISSALILEDDSDWDVRIRTIMQELAVSTHALTQPLVGTLSSYADPTYPNNSARAAPAVSDFDFAALPRTAQPTWSPYGDEWEMLWLGHCGMQFPVAKAGLPMARVIRKNDTTVPPSGLWSLGNPFELRQKYEKRTRAVHHVYQGVCSLGYAVTQKGARGLLREIGLREVKHPLDIMLSFYCEGSHGRRQHNCIAVQPPVFNHHRPRGPKSANSDIGNLGTGFTKTASTDMVQWSVRLNADAIMDGKTEFEDAFQ